MINLKECPCCKGTKFFKKLDCKDHSTSKEEFQIVSCETCGFIITNPRPLIKKLDKYYASDMYISHTNKKKGLFNWLYQTIRKYAVKKKVLLLESEAKKDFHLDIGCGTGEFLNACKQKGFITKGIEPSKLARDQAKTNFNLDVSANIDLSQFSSNQFYSISMWHVLEHVPNINETLSQLQRILHPDGIIIVAVPNCNSWDANYYKEYWAAWDVPIHLWHFSKESITNLFKNYNFKITRIKPMVFDSFYVSLLSEEFKYGKKNFIKSFLIGLYSNFVGILSKRGHSSRIYIFKPQN